MLIKKEIHPANKFMYRRFFINGDRLESQIAFPNFYY
jgi:hypothetical protein